ncbi:MAG TPA: hypothetical protein VHH88_12970, partial [Verrucomicrobiae bacterium]|nr:hypothetical protein [Verrucomicrobiae bacterium]
LGPAPDSAVRTSEAETHIQGMNALHLERQVKNWWLLSAGYLYSRLNGDASLNQATVNAMSVPTAGSFWSADGVLLERESQVLSVGNLLLPAKGFSLSAGVQAEWTRQQGMGEVHLDSGDPNLPASFLLYPAAVRSDLDQRRVSENFLARFTRIPYTVLFAEARLDQDAIGQSERDAPFAGVTADPSTTFLRNTEYSNDRHDARAGFDSSPWRWVSFGGHIDARLSDSDYDNMRVTLDPGGYPAFIRSRKIDTGEWQGKVSLKPFSWLKTTVTYKNTSTKYFTGTDPVPEATLPSVLQAGDYHANEYGVSATLTPFARLYFSGAFTWSDSRITTATHGDPSIAPYAGNVISVLGSASYILNKTTELTAAYSFSRAAYGQDNFVDGLPLGLDFTRHGLTAGISRKWTQSLSTSLRYAFYKYSEPSTGGINDYTAHGIFASLNFTWP